MRFQRCELLFGDDFDKIKNAKIILFGVGGVGGFCLDALYRTGIWDISIVDFDKYEITNQNRQIGSEAIGEKKVEALKKIYPTVEPIFDKVTKQWVENFDFSPYDLVIDAIDDIDAKVALAHKSYKKLISSCGGAKRVDPTLITIDKIWKTTNDPFAKKFRYELKKSGFKNSFDVVYSKELPKSMKELGSFVGVTGTLGLSLASLAIKKLTIF